MNYVGRLCSLLVFVVHMVKVSINSHVIFSIRCAGETIAVVFLSIIFAFILQQQQKTRKRYETSFKNVLYKKGLEKFFRILLLGSCRQAQISLEIVIIDNTQTCKNPRIICNHVSEPQFAFYDPL